MTVVIRVRNYNAGMICSLVPLFATRCLQVIDLLPRQSLGGAVAPKNLAKYNLLNCTEGDFCTFNDVGLTSCPGVTLPATVIGGGWMTVCVD